MKNNKQFLIIDDDPSIRNIISVRLNSMFIDAEIKIAPDIKTAKELLINQSYSLIFLDQNLPDGLGVEVFELINLEKTAVIAMSSDKSSDLPAKNMLNGADFFISKDQLSNSFFMPLVKAITEKKEIDVIAKQKTEAELKLKTVSTLINTLQHEINNPLGAIYGAIFLLKQENANTDDKTKAICLMEESSKRIHTVLEKLKQTTELKQVEKSTENLFHVPGDKEWN